nr:hypothetical protein CFP56_16503 [Quercus suber]POF04892.1 hypothetical protein CFP56_73853 [Quercus suber]
MGRAVRDVQKKFRFASRTGSLDAEEKADPCCKTGQTRLSDLEVMLNGLESYMCHRGGDEMIISSNTQGKLYSSKME